MSGRKGTHRALWIWTSGALIDGAETKIPWADHVAAWTFACLFLLLMAASIAQINEGCYS